METNKLVLKTDSFTPIRDKFISIVDEATFQKESSFAIQHLMKNSYLAGADKNSILMAVLNIAQIGLTLNPALKLAYLVPRRVGGNLECVLEPSYQGLVKLATDTGSVRNIYAHLIHEKDTFSQTLGTSPEIIHSPKLGNRGNVIGVYAVAILQDGSKQIEVMDVSEIDEIKETSESWKSFKAGKSKSCIWNDYFDEMARKTIIKRICKYLPKTEMWDKLGKAIEMDNEDYAISYAQANLLDSLIQYATIPEERKEMIEKTMNLMSRDEATKLIEELKEKQVDAINGGVGYNQTQIKEKLKEF
jgi:recombination protein RecT